VQRNSILQPLLNCIAYVKHFKGVIKSCKSKKDIQYNGQKKYDKKTNNDQEDTAQKTKD
jgi:hypothetical protein